MNVGAVSFGELTRLLSGPGLRLRTGPFVAKIRSDSRRLAQGLSLHYADHALEDEASFADFHVSVARPPSIRRWVAPQVRFRLDGHAPFHPLPAGQAFAVMEWGLNWCISELCHQYITIHAAVLERASGALIMPAPPGAGKSTLCAGLVCRGWRLLSDELTLIDPASRLVLPLVRPVGLKNNSIDLIRAFDEAAVVGPAVNDTIKGTVAHMKPPSESVRRSAEPARPRWIVLPRYEPGAESKLEPYPKAQAFMQLADHSFNYDLHGPGGFEVLSHVIDECECYRFTYSRLADACRVFEELSSAA